MNKQVKGFYDGLGISVIDMLEKGKHHPWRLHAAQIEYAMDEIRLLILDEQRNGDTYHGPIPRRIFERARSVKADQYQMLTHRIDGYQEKIKRLETERNIFIILEAATLFGWAAVTVYGVFF